MHPVHIEQHFRFTFLFLAFAKRKKPSEKTSAHPARQRRSERSERSPPRLSIRSSAYPARIAQAVTSPGHRPLSYVCHGQLAHVWSAAVNERALAAAAHVCTVHTCAWLVSVLVVTLLVLVGGGGRDWPRTSRLRRSSESRSVKRVGEYLLVKSECDGSFIAGSS